MIEHLTKNELFLQYFPPVAGLILVFVFVLLGMWQLDRAAEKAALLEIFENDAPYVHPTDYDSLHEFDRIETFGQFMPHRQVLIDNIPYDGRPGYFVITPFQPLTDGALLLVNRGWTPKTGPNDIPDVQLDGKSRTVRGLVGHLPQVAVRPGEAFAIHGAWPRVAVFPTLDEVATELDETLLPIILLLHPDADDGFARRWQPDTTGPMTHHSYAFQWFTMALAVILIVVWNLRKKFASEQNKA